MKLALAVLFAVAAFGQTREIRGIVIEDGLNVPLPGAQVSIFAPSDKQPIGTVFTDANGTFTFAVPRMGTYQVEVSKSGYVDTQNNNREVARRPALFLAEAQRVQNVQIALMRPGSLTGRILDEDRKPVADLRVLVQAGTGSARATGRAATTNADGVFTAIGLNPQAYVVRIASESSEVLTILEDSPDEFKIIDQDVETSFWPTVPIRVQPGVPTYVGIITVRNVPHYRARVHVSGDCESDEVWRVAVIRLPYNSSNEFLSTSAPCRHEFLIPNLPAGSYSLAISTSILSNLWAQVPLVISSENIEVSLRMSPTADLSASAVVPSGVSAPDLSKINIVLRPQDAPFVGAGYAFQPRLEGGFSLANVPWQHHSFSISGVPTTHFIRDIRYAGQPVVGSSLSISDGGHLEIVLDDHPATIKGTIKGYTRSREAMPDFTTVALVREPFLSSDPPFAYLTFSLGDGSFEFKGLAPGDYRLKAGSIGILRDSSPTGVVVHVAAGDTKSVEVTLP